MAKMCEVCGKAPVFGNRISHAHNVSSRRWLPNLQRVRVKIGKAVRRMNVCTRCLRSGKVKVGETIAMCALGAGISWGGAIVRM